MYTMRERPKRVRKDKLFAIVLKVIQYTALEGGRWKKRMGRKKRKEEKMFSTA
jgi:hypothetical protein